MEMIYIGDGVWLDCRKEKLSNNSVEREIEISGELFLMCRNDVKGEPYVYLFRVGV